MIRPIRFSAAPPPLVRALGHRRPRGRRAGLIALLGLSLSLGPPLGCDRRDPGEEATDPTLEATELVAEAADEAAGDPPIPTGPPTGTAADDPLLRAMTGLPPLASIEPGPPPALDAALAPFFRLIGDGRPDVARVRLRKHLALEPDDGQAHFLFGLTYHRERRYSEAIPWFADAVRLAPGYGPSFYFAAWGRFYLGELAFAERLWRRHLAHEPDAADTHFGLGLVALEEGRPEEAATRFRNAIAIEEDLPDRERSVAKAWARLGDALADMDRTTEAREAMERAVALWPDHHEAWARLGRLLRRLGEADAAAEAEAQAAAALDRTRAAGGRRP